MGSRGTTIITQKENKGEYNGVNCWGEEICSGEWINSNWYWNNSNYDWNIYAHVFDQSDKNSGIPYQYSTTISDWSESGNEYWIYPNAIPRCTTMTLEENQKNHKRLYSGTSIPSTSKACVPNTHNSGNWYNYAAATAGSDNSSTVSIIDVPNSICPKGWRLPPTPFTSDSGDLNHNKSYYKLIHDTYGITTTDSDTTFLANPAMSFTRLGYYAYNYGSLNGRGYNGYYWSSTAYGSDDSYILDFYSERLSPRLGGTKAIGLSIRCVSR